MLKISPSLTLFLAGLLLQCEVVDAQTQEELDNQNRFIEEIDYSINDSDYFREYIDPYSGSLAISHQDLFIPGNGGLDLEIIRHYVSPPASPPNYQMNQGKYRMGYGWDIHFGYILHPYWGDRDNFEDWQTSILGNSSASRFSTCYMQTRVISTGSASSFDNSMILVTQDGSTQYLANALSNDYAFATKGGWRGGCAATGFIMYSPEGLKYTFDQDKYTAFSSRHDSTSYSYAWYVSRIEDKYGNWISINYAPSEQALIDSVTTSDGRTISFGYTTIDGYPTLTSISANGETISYLYDGNRNLAQVRIGSRVVWRYTYEPFFHWLVEATIYLLKTVTTESGGIIEYTNAQQGPYYTSESPPVVVSHRKISGTLPQSEISYGYGILNYPEGRLMTNWIRESDRCTKNYFHSAWGSPWRAGTLLRTEVYRNPDCTDLIESTKYEWGQVKISSQEVRREFFARYVGLVHHVEDADYWKAVLTKKTITRDGGDYTTTYTDFTAFGKPRTIVETNPLGESRTIRRTYVDSPYQYGLELLSSTVIESASGQIVNESSIEYDVVFSPIEKTVNGLSTFFSYDADGNIHTIADGRGNVATLSSYYRGQARLVSDAVGVKSQSIDYFGNVTSITDELNHTTTFGYEDFNRLIRMAPPIGASIAYTYTSDSVVVTYGNYVKTTDLDGYRRPLLVTEEDVSRGLTRYRNYEYDIHDRTAFVSIASASPTEVTGTTYAYDDLDRLTQVSSPIGEITYQYPAAGEMRQVDSLGNQVIVTYGGYGSPDYSDVRQLQYNSSSGVITVGLSKDAAGRIQLVSQGGHTIEYDYHNAYRDLVAEQRYPQLTVYLNYDAAGNLTSRKVNGSDPTVFVYDTRNRLITKDYPSGTSDVQLRYYPTDQLRTAANGWGDWSFEYDSNRNPVVRSLVTDGKVFPFEYSFDPQNNLSGITYPGGLHVDYAPNAFGQATKAGGYATNVQHHPQGAIRSFTYGNGLTYDLSMAPNKVLIDDILGKSGGATVIHKHYQYDSEINVTGITDYVNPQYSVSQFAYDAINRLTSASSPAWGGTISFAYDKTGNITSQVLAGETRTYTYDGSNQLVQVTGLSPKSFDYDLYGNVRDNGNHSFIYNDAGQLISAKNAVDDNVYIYDALGKRIQVIDGAGNITYEVYDSSNRLLLVEEPDGSLKHKIYLGNKLIAQDRGGSIQYMHFDTLGSTIAISDQSGQLDLEHYRPYGDKVENPQGTGNRQWYTAKPFNDDISLSYYGARYYDAAIGRFYSVDPAGFVGVHSFNRYAYANSNPYTYIDPDGRSVDVVVDIGFIVYDSGRFLGAAAAAVVGTVTDNEALRSVGLEGMRDTGIDLGASAASAVIPGLAAPLARGLASEARVLKELGEVKNTERVVTSQGRTIPDFQNSRQVGEIKDTKRVSDTRQIRAQREHAQTTGREHTVITGTNTKVSSTVDQESVIIRREDLGPQQR